MADNKETPRPHQKQGDEDSPKQQSSAKDGDKLIERLREFFEEHGVEFKSGWRVDVKHRKGGSSAGTSDVYYFSPSGKRYRSRAEIARDHGIDVPKPVRTSAKKKGAPATASTSKTPAETLSREDAWTKAQVHGSKPTPLVLSNGVTVTHYGRPNPHYTTPSSLPMIGFSSEWTDANGVVFKSSITDSGTAPYYVVYAKIGSTSDGNTTTNTGDFIEVGSGLQPDAAWHVVAERQQDTLDHHHDDKSTEGKDAVNEGEAQEPPTKKSIDPVDSILRKAAPLSTQIWGTERFGLADIVCLQALEGQPGVVDTLYTFVDERYGWEEERRLLVQEAHRHDHGKGKGALSKQKRAKIDRSRPKTQQERDASVVHRLLDGMIRHIETEEARSAAADQKAAFKRERELQRMVEKEQRRLVKEREREMVRQQQDRQRELMRAAALEAARTLPDEVLPTAAVTPPRPRPIGQGLLPPACEPSVVEAWHIAHRFASLLELEYVPSLEEIERGLVHGNATYTNAASDSLEKKEKEAVAGPGVHDDVGDATPGQLQKETQKNEQQRNEEDSTSDDGDAASYLARSFITLLITDLYNSAAEIIAENNPDVKESDLRPTPRSSLPIPITQDSWQEAARRYIVAVAACAVVWGQRGHCGLPFPLHVLQPEVVVQMLTAGPPSDLNRGPIALPKNAASHALSAMNARADAVALKNSGCCIVDTDQGIASEIPREEQHRELHHGKEIEIEKETSIRVQRCILHQLLNTHGEKGKHARLLCFQGDAAAAAAKFGRPLDLLGVAARVDAGVYALRAEPLSEFSADVNYVCALHQAAAHKHNSEFAAENVEKGIAEIAAMVVSKLEAIMGQINKDGIDAFLISNDTLLSSSHGNEKEKNKEEENKEEENKEEDKEEEDKKEEHRHEDDEDHTQKRKWTDQAYPFCPWDNVCTLCWGDEDAERLFTCSQCDREYHVYCVDPPLVDYESIDEDAWKCQYCTALQQNEPLDVRQKAPSFARGSQGDVIWSMAQLLSTTDYSSWTPVQRTGLLSILCDLVAESPALRDRLTDEENEQREIRKELFAKRNELKQRQLDLGAAKQQQQQTQQQQQQTSHRRARDITAEIESLVQRISHLEHATHSDLEGKQRLEPIGLDRHYNRYYVLPASALNTSREDDISGPGAIFVERHRSDTAMISSTAMTSPATMTSSTNKSPHKPRWMETESTEWHVGIYPVEDFDDLHVWLNPKGHRERALQTELLKNVHLIKNNPKRMSKSSVDDSTGSATLSIRKMLPSHQEERIRSSLIDFEAGWMAGARDPLRGSPHEMDAWRNKAAKASTPQQLMSVLVLLESSVAPEWLKPHWRVWAMPAPDPLETKTYSSVWLRLEAMKMAVRMRITLKLPSRDSVVRHTLRQQEKKTDRADISNKQQPGASRQRSKRSFYADGSRGPSSNAESGGNGSRDRGMRAAKRSRVNYYDGEDEDDEDNAFGGQSSAVDTEDDDEALARKLDAQLNAAGHSLRSRLRHVVNSSDIGGRGGRKNSSKRSLRAGARQSYREEDDDASEEEWNDDETDVDDDVDDDASEEEEPARKNKKHKRGESDDEEEEYESDGEDE